jgi:hypothetical protein
LIIISWSCCHSCCCRRGSVTAPGGGDRQGDAPGADPGRG